MAQYGGYQQQGGYGQSNPYDQRGGYGGNNYNQGGGYGQGGDVEMQPMQGQQGYNGGSAPAGDPNQILNDCRDVDRGIDQIEQDLTGLQSIHYNILHSSGDPRDNRAGNARLEQANDSIIASYTALVQRMKKVKGLRGSAEPRNAPQVGRVDRRLKATINKYQTIERDFRRELQESIARQYRIVRPDATEEEVRQATEDPTQQVFTQALMQSDRRGQAQTALNNVSARHEAIQKIERDMITLAQLFQDLETAVIEQEPLVENIEQKGEEVHENVTKANVEIDTAIKSAESRKRKKWWCLLITILIILIIVAIVVVVVIVTKK
jgi:syntaxin 1B/2/3